MVEPELGREMRSVLAFRLGRTVLGLPVERVQEVLPLPELSRPPLLPGPVEGFFNLGGEAVPVLRPDRLLELPEIEPGLYTPLILLRGEGVALLVEEVLGVGPASEAALPPGTALNDCVVACAAWNGEPLQLLAPELLLLARERACVAELQAVEARRLGALAEPGT